MSEPVRIVVAPGAPPELLSSIEVALKRLAHKHWAQVREAMIKQGFDPAQGGVLVLPEADEPKTPGHRPPWVAFNAHVTKPGLINPRALGLMPGVPQ